ncbi:hypothetical protein CDD80_573 [Ophiocordyceps camponoti-rufipedis]|uniref:Uncharacterized protein n=1 Tax=Ophiocordyceps camponoti-rufipedis TaxID=2004952 RepID=A0A2C5ZDF1_9HYPO|nr:hypothetical protein CDD80_573 [Ophiocordyceps camponoti-rufipedis]
MKADSTFPPSAQSYDGASSGFQTGSCMDSSAPTGHSYSTLIAGSAPGSNRCPGCSVCSSYGNGRRSEASMKFSSDGRRHSTDLRGKERERRSSGADTTRRSRYSDRRNSTDTNRRHRHHPHHHHHHHKHRHHHAQSKDTATSENPKHAEAQPQRKTQQSLFHPQQARPSAAPDDDDDDDEPSGCFGQPPKQQMGSREANDEQAAGCIGRRAAADGSREAKKSKRRWRRKRRLRCGRREVRNGGTVLGQFPLCF